MKGSRRKAVFAFFAVALLLVVSLSSLGLDQTTSDAGIGVIVPEERDYAYKLTTDKLVINGVSGETIVKVEYWDENKEHHLIYSDNIYKNLLYTTDDPSIVNPNTSEFFKFDELTGIGPFNSFYAAINIGDTSHNGDEHKLSSVNGQIAYILNAYNLDQAIISDTEGVGAYTGLKDNVAYYDEWEHSDYNVMLFIPTVYWHAADKDDSDESYLWLTNKPNFFDTVPGEDVDPNKMEARAHTVMGKVSPYLALGVYEASVRGDKLVSQSDMNPENYKSISQFRNLSNKLNEGIEGGTYMIWNFYQWTLYKMMSYTVIGTKNSQVAIGKGVVTSSTASLRVTGQGDAQGPYWGGKNLDGSGSYTDGRHGSKLFLENSWGSFHDLLDDTWTFDGQLHAGHNDSDYINEHINPDASYWDGNQPRKGSDEGLNEIQQLLGNAKINDSRGNGSLIAIASTYTNPEYWDFPDKIGGNAYAGIASSVQYTSGNQTLCVGGHYDARDTGGLNRINIRNSFGMGKLDIGTRLAYVTTGGAITFTAGEYSVDTDKGEVFSGMSVQEGTEVVITATGADDITAVFINGEKLQKTGTVFKFSMPDMDVHLEVIVGNKIPIPEPSSYIYDGSTHSALYGNDYYTITGVNTAKNAGQYAVTLTPIEGFKWLDGTTTAKELPWAIEKRTLMVEGSSGAKIVKVYDGTTNLVMDHVDSLIERDDLFIHGLADGEVPEFVYTGSYDNKNAGVYKKINITSFVMNASETYDPNNYVYTFIKFVIVGTDVVITTANLDFDGHIAAVTESYIYSGEENTPQPIVRYKDLWNLTKDKDFSYEYTDNINAGTATVRAVGVGNYSGSVSTTFTIDKLVIEWPEIVEKEYNGEVQTAGLLNTDYYTVVSDASGKEISLDGYPATLRLISPSNTRWVDSESSDRTAVALKITDKSNPLTFRFEEMGSWIVNYEWPRAYMSSQGLTLPGREKVSVVPKQGYVRTFEGWYVTGDEEKTLVTEIPAGSYGARSYTALYAEVPSTYTVSFSMQNHGEQVESQTIQYQGKVVKPSDPEAEGYDFGGWFKDSNCTTAWNFDEDIITKDEVIFAKWTLRTYTVVWKNGDTVLQTDVDVPYGTTPSYHGVDPTKASTAQYSYTFSGWEPSITPLDSDRVYTAQFTPVVNTYTITFQTSDKFTLSSSSSLTVEYGTEFDLKLVMNDGYKKSLESSTVFKTVGGVTSEISRIPGKVDEFSFTVVGETYISVSEPDLDTFSVKWKYWDTIDHYVTYEGVGTYGSLPDAPTIVQQFSNVQYTYSFTGWSPSVEVVYDDAEYTAQYSSEVNQYELKVPLNTAQYEIVLKDSDGNVIPERTNLFYDYNSVFYLTLTMKEGYDQSHPDLSKNGVRQTPVQGVYTFILDGTVSVGLSGSIALNVYTVTWYDEDGTTELTKTSVEHGSVPITPADPSKGADVQYTYAFDSWVPKEAGGPGLNDPVLGNEAFKATYNSVLKTYTVSFQQSSAGDYLLTNLGQTMTVEYGSTFRFQLTMGAAFTQGLKDVTVTATAWGTSSSLEEMAETEGDPEKSWYEFIVTGNTLINVSDYTKNTYNIYWYYMDSYDHWTTSPVTVVEYGETPAYYTSMPQQVSSPAYTKTIVSVTPAVGPATEDRTYTMGYSDPVDRYYGIEVAQGPQFTITLKNADESPIEDPTNVKYGTVVLAVLTMADAYTQSNPFLLLNGVPIADKPAEDTYRFTVGGDSSVTIGGQIKYNSYTVTWLNGYGIGEAAVVTVQTVSHGAIPTPPAGPQKPSDDEYSFTFKQWVALTEGSGLDVPITKDTVFEATYDHTKRSYAVTFQQSSTGDYVFTAISPSSTVEYGSDFEFKLHVDDAFNQSLPVIEVYAEWGNQKVTLTKTGVTEEGDYLYSVNVVGTTKITLGKITRNVYTVTWNYISSLDEHDVETWDHVETEVRHGQTPEPPSSIISSVHNAQYTKTLNGWTGTPFEPATGDIEYNAAYSTEINTYSLTVPSSTAQFTITLEKVTDQGNVPVPITTDMTAEYGTEFIITIALDSKFNQSTVGFLKNGVPISDPAVGSKTDNFTVLSDTIIALDANISINFYDVKWYNGSTLLQTEHVQYGYTTTYPGSSNPTKESTASHIYTFNRWVVKGTEQAIPINITQDWEFEAEYTESDRYYDVTFQTSSGEFTIHTEQSTHVKYNDTFTFEVELGVTHSKSIDSIKAVPVIGGTPGALINPTSKVGNTATFTCTITDDVRFNFSGININTYTVTWNYKTGPSTIVQTTTTVVHGVSAQAPSTVPSSFSNSQYTWTLSGWSPALHPITSDGEEFTAQYNATVNTYSLTVPSSTAQFTITLEKITDQGNVPVPITTNMTAEYGTEFIITIALDSKFNQSTVGFLKNGVPISEPTVGSKTDHFTILGNTEIGLNANISINFYDVKWYNGSTLLQTEHVQYGYTTTYPGSSNPTKESTASHTYSFSKWVVRGTQQDIPTNITQDWEFEAKYDENDRTYHITLPSSGTYTIAPKQGSSLDTVYGHDFTFVFTTEYEITKFDFYIDGTSIPRPTSVGEGQYEYTVSNIVKDILISITDNTSSQYDVVWKNSDGSTLYIQKVGHNEISAYPGASNPTKQPTADSVFAFKGWLPAAGQAVTSDMEFVAQYTSSPRYYDMTFQASSGEFTVHTEQSTHVKYNDTFVFQVELAVSHSKFIDELKAVPVVGGVSGEPIDPISVEGRTATFSYTVTDDVRFTFPGIKINTYTVTWIYKTGPTTEVHTTSTNVHGIAPQAPTSIPASFSNPQYTWTLSGWSPSLHPITSDGEEFTAQYTPTINKYSLTVPSSTPQFTITLEKVTAQGSEPVNLSQNDTWDYGTEFIITVDLDSKFNQSTVGFLKNGVPISEPTVGSKTDHFTILGNTEIGLNANISINFYDVKWYNGSTLLQTEHVQYGYTTTYPGSSNPTKESTASHTYSFSKWVVRGTQQDIPTNITQDWEFEAKYTENDRYYDVTFQTSSGEFTIHTEQSTHVKYNDTFVFQVELGVTHSKSIENIKAVPVIGGTPGASINPTSKVGNTATFSCTITDDVRFNFSGVSINTYTVTWNYKTGPSTDVQTTTTVVHGVPSQAPTTVPVSFSNTQYTWTLSGWSSAMHPITSDGEEFTAQYSVTVNKYNVNVLSTTPQLIIGLKKVVGTELIDITDRNFKDDYGATYRVYATFTERYTQSTLSMTKNGVTMSPFEPGVYEFTIEGDTAIDFNGQIKMNTYTVTWIINEDDTKVDTVAYGTVPDADSIIPSWPSTQQYHYEFDKWTSNITGVTVTTPVTQDVTYTAQYNPVLNKYGVTFQQSDDYTFESTASVVVDYGSEIQFSFCLADRYDQCIETASAYATIGDSPASKINNGTVSGKWKTVTYTVTDDAHITVGNISINTYSVTWTYRSPTAEWQSVTLEDIRYGQTPQPPTITNSVTDGQVRYTFSSWSPSVSPTFSDKTYEAVYSETPETYYVTYPSDIEGQYSITYTVVSGHAVAVDTHLLKVDYGSVLYFTLDLAAAYDQSDAPIKKGSQALPKVQGESNTYELVLGMESVDLTVGQMSKNQYTVQWKNYDGTQLIQQTVEYNTVLEYSGAAPVKPRTSEWSYVHIGWESNIPGVTVETPVTQNVIYTAQFDPIKNSYTVTLQNSASFVLTRVSESDLVPYGEEYEFMISLGEMFTQSLQNVRGWKTINSEKTIIEDEGTIIGDYKYITFTVTGDTYVTLEGLQPNKYNITWTYLNEELEEVQVTTKSVHNVVPGSPNIPSVVENESVRKTFTGWSPALSPALGEASYTAVYDTEDVLYDLKWPVDTEKYTVKLYQLIGGQDPVEITQHSLQTTYSTEYRIIVTMTDAYSKSTPAIQINGVGAVYVNEGSATLDFTITTDTTLTISGSMPINTYTVRWMNGEEQISLQTLPHGTVTAYPGTSTPSKQPTQSTVYVFDGWLSNNPGIQYGDILTSDVVFTADYDEDVRQYNIYWRNYDGSVITSSLVDYGTTPTYPGAEGPSRPQDAKNKYEFSGWAPEIVQVSGDASYTAQYTVIPLKVTITWKNYNGAILKVQTDVSSGTTPQYDGASPTRSSTAQYTYTFSGWDPAVVQVYQDTEYTAVFEESINNYTIIWSNYDGTILQSGEVPYGTVPAYSGDVPLKDPDVQYTYTFSGWSKEIEPVSGDTTYFAIYDSELRIYTVTWLSFDGSELRQDEVRYGSIPEYHGVTPVKVTPLGYKHTWTGWEEEIVPVTGDVSYTASFVDSIYDIHLTVKVAEDEMISHGTIINAGTVVVDSNGLLNVYDDVLYVDGTLYSFTPVPDTGEDEYCAFISWYINDVPIDGSYQLTGEDLTVEGRFVSIPVKAMLSVSTYINSEMMGNFKLDDDDPQIYVAVEDIKVGSTFTVDDNKIMIDGKTVTAIPVSTRANPNAIVFKEWVYMVTGEKVMNGDRVTALTAVGAVFEKTEPAEYTVTWKNDDGTTLLGPVTLKEGDIPDYPEVPVKTSSGGSVYVFERWDPEIGPVGEDTVYTAVYKEYTDTVLITVDLDGSLSNVVSEDKGWTYDHKTGLYSKEFDKSSQQLDLGTTTKEEGLHYRYVFIGWVTPSGDLVTPTTAAFAHYRAEMTEIPKEFTVTFDAAGGTVQGSATKKLSYGETYGELPTAVLDGYDFAGWFTHMAGGQQITPETVFTEAKDLSVYAHWDKIVPPGPDPPGPDPPGPTPPGPTPPKPDPDHHKETEVIVNPDGSVTTKVTEYDRSKDGTVTNKVTETTNYPDGSSLKTVDEKIRYTDGTVVENKSDTRTHPDGSKTSTEITIHTDAEGNSEKVTIHKHTDPSGHYTSTEETEVNGGKVTVEKEGDKGSESVSPDIVADIGKETEVSEEVSKVIQEKINEIIKGKEDPNVVITTDTPTSIPRTVFETVIEGDGSLTYIEDGNTLFFTAKVLKGIGMPVHESSLSIVEIDVPSEYDLEHAVVYSITLTVDGVEYHELFDGTVKVTVPYELDDGQTVDRISVYYLHDGQKDSIEFDYIEECVVFYLPHMSMYAIDYDYDDPVPVPGGDQSYLIYAAVGAMAVLMILLAAVLLLRRRS